MGNVVSGAHNSSFPSCDETTTGKIKSPYLGPSLKEVNKSLCEMEFSVRPSCQADQAVQAHAKLQQQAGA